MPPFLFGIVLGAAGAVVLKGFVRPLAKTAMKGSIQIARKVQEVHAEVVEDLADLKAEVDADLAAEAKKAEAIEA